MAVVSVVGFKKSGKTTLAGLLAEAMEGLGLRVGVVKFSGHALDLPGTDTATLLRPDRPVAGLTAEGTAFFHARSLPFPEVARCLDVDVVLVEGGKTRVSAPRILCLREAEEAPTLAGGNPVLACVGAVPPADFSYVPHFPEISPDAAKALAAIVQQHLGASAKNSAAPSCSVCPEHLNRRPCRESCPKKHGRVALCLAGRPVNCNAFVERIIEGTVRGLLAQLGGCDGAGEIVLTLKDQEERRGQ